MMKLFVGVVILASLLSTIVAQSVHPTTADCTWKYIRQPLSHFERANAGYYNQRLCVNSDYWTPGKSLPVFLYTGNESPVEEYVNNTGLLWNLAKKYSALVVFAEHRYFGESIPDIEGMANCMAYLSSEEALADYAMLASTIRSDWGADDSAIIAFGGSYGGMLASWLRIKYPGSVDGAIAASAPVLGFPLDSCPLDGSAQVVSYAASSKAGAAPRCADNLKSAYVLLSDIGRTTEGREYLSSQLNLCQPLQSQQDISTLLTYLQSPLFNLAEGSYPFPSNYITFALTGSDAPLPPWAMQVMCSHIEADFGVAISGDPSSVVFSVSVGNISVSVDWDATKNNGYTLDEVTASNAIALLHAVTASSQVWYNVTGLLPSCISWTGASAVLNARSSSSDVSATANKMSSRGIADIRSKSTPREYKVAENNICTAKKESVDAMTAWNVLTCNEGLNLVNWQVQGVGRDLYWPPNQPRNFTLDSVVKGSLAYCAYLDASGFYGTPRNRDEWSSWLETAYGGRRGFAYHSNIVYSNGNLDPWQVAGVPVTQNAEIRMSASQNGVVSLVIDMGGHHLDLFWEDENDPESVRKVRQIEEANIQQWIGQTVRANL